MAEPERILRMRTVLQRIGLSRSTVYRKMKEGTFPSQVRLSEHCSGWRESEINRWINDPVHYGGGDRKRSNPSKDAESFTGGALG
ncbi:prophage regulatory protein [Rhizomicrobium palustre]|uniref:Prophage regulatory protein n=1 Tax=Rhizomicrobium palustre TaxID=189966 RepID=A0A846MZS6_9PROT|nr:AlpA family transcriptional regulator [Rhizomicrobium palustre]NIK88512.1 prophage regulatory protein [Rhizomicrobium palustre]